MAPPKKQQQKLSLGDFLSDQTLGSWADEMEDMPLGTSAAPSGYGGGARTFGSAGGYADRGFASTNDRNYAVREALPLPTKPPYTAHLGNLSFDATEGDISDFFSGCEVTNVRIVEDKMERKPKGFGYVEFGTLDGLKKALELNGTQFQGRNIRTSVAEPPKDREGQREITDWTRKGPLPDLPGGNRRPSERTGGYGRTFGDNGSDAGSERGGDRRRPAFESDGKVRDFSNWERKGPLSPVPGAGSGPGLGLREGGRQRSNNGARQERRQSPAWGEGRQGSNDGSRPPRREFADRPAYVDRQPTAPELDNQWRTKMRPDAPAKSPSATPDASTPSSPAPSHAAPAPLTSRPKLNLTKRTVSESDPSPATASSASDSKANPFGAARPIDTATREKEIEEKRVLALKQKQEQIEKARDEKKAKEAAARTAEKEKAAQTPTSPKEATKDAKENGDDKTKSYEILRRAGEDSAETEEPTDDAIDASANGNIIGDTAVKPKEIVRNAPKAPAEGGAWRRKSNIPSAPNESTTQVMEDDGWSTVPQKGPKGRRGGPQGSRTIAS